MKRKSRFNLQKKSAVALRYNQIRDKAPKVVAKGEGILAERIISLARENGIPVKEDPDLTQVLSQVDIDAEVPPAMYKVVAELLAFVYKVNRDFAAKVRV